MLNLGMRDALYLWSDLEQAYYGDNSYGGHTAELYAYRFGEQSPIRWYTEERLAASRALYLLLLEFQKYRKCTIKVNNVEFGDWLLKERFAHRVHVEIIPQRGPL